MTVTIGRRELLAALGGAAAWPLAARAQQQLPVIGFLRSTVASGFEHLETALRHGLDEEGFVEGRNVVIEYRYADNQRDRLPALVDDLIRRSVYRMLNLPQKGWQVLWGRPESF